MPADLNALDSRLLRASGKAMLRLSAAGIAPPVSLLCATLLECLALCGLISVSLFLGSPLVAALAAVVAAAKSRELAGRLRYYGSDATKPFTPASSARYGALSEAQGLASSGLRRNALSLSACLVGIYAIAGLAACAMSVAGLDPETPAFMGMGDAAPGIGELAMVPLVVVAEALRRYAECAPAADDERPSGGRSRPGCVS